MFQTEVAEKVKPHILYSVTPPPRKSLRIWSFIH